MLGVWACNLFASGIYYQKFSYKIESFWFQCTNDDIWEIGMLSKWGGEGGGGGGGGWRVLYPIIWLRFIPFFNCMSFFFHIIPYLVLNGDINKGS